MRKQFLLSSSPLESDLFTRDFDKLAVCRKLIKLHQEKKNLKYIRREESGYVFYFSNFRSEEN